MENCCDRDVSFSFVFFFIRVTCCEKNRWIRYNKIWRKNSVYLKIPTNFPANLPCILSNLSNDRSRKYLISLKNRFILAFNQNSSRVTSTTTFDFIKTIRITEFRERSVPSPLIADQFSNFRGVVADSEGKKEARRSSSIRPDRIYVRKETHRILRNRVFHRESSYSLFSF